MSTESINELLNLIRTETEQIIGANLKEAILYGSYARGDYNSESDIDIALIVNSSRADTGKYRKQMVALINELSLTYDVLVSISCIPQIDFEKYKDALPYYRNIDSEGVRLSA